MYYSYENGQRMLKQPFACLCPGIWDDNNAEIMIGISKATWTYPN